MAQLLSVAQAHARLLGDVSILGSERVGLAEASGRVLASDLAARLTQPPFDASAMDGYAVRAGDLAALAADPSAKLKVVGEAAAGRAAACGIGAGECVRIFTGAPLPEGADAILIQEDVDREGDFIALRQPSQAGVQAGSSGNPLSLPAAGTFVRPRGYDFTAGDVMLPAGAMLGPRTVSLAAAMGHAGLEVRRRPRVAILATGDELVPPGEKPGPDQIVSSTPIGLAPMIAAAGAQPQLLGIARDSMASLDQHIAAAESADILITIGGASVGEHDLVHASLAARGMALDFWRIAMRPGKPLLFGRLGAQRVLGLPGNPVSSFICTRVFVVPLIRALLGLDPHQQGRFCAQLAAPLEANGPRQHYLRATSNRFGLAGPDSAIAAAAALPLVTPAGSQDSSLLSVLSQADCLIVRAPNAPALAAGGVVDVLDLDF